MKRISIITTLGVFCISSSVYSAVFSLRYEGNNAATVTINGKQYKVGGKDSSVRVDTGLEQVSKIAWTDKELYGSDLSSAREKDYEVTLPKNVNAMNLGGTFTISADGNYSYYFGIDTNWKTVEGKALQIGKARRAW